MIAQSFNNIKNIYLAAEALPGAKKRLAWPKLRKFTAKGLLYMSIQGSTQDKVLMEDQHYQTRHVSGCAPIYVSSMSVSCAGQSEAT